MPSPAPTSGSSVPARLVPAGVLAGRIALLLSVLWLLAGCAVGGGGAESAADEPGLGEDPVGGVVVDPARDDPAGVAPAATGRRPARFRASGVLAAWDRARARAFADGDSDALRGLYVTGSAAGTSDQALLRAYRARGLHVEGMRMQLLAVEVLHRAPDVLRLRVTDRLTGAVVVGQDTRIALPRDHASTRVVELRRSPAGAWQVARVRP